MTPPGDGGPDLLPCPFGCGDPGKPPRVCRELQGWLVRCEDCWADGPCCDSEAEAIRWWNNRHASRRPTTRDAALREEGRVQERADVVAYLRRRVERWRPEATANGERFGQLVNGLAFESDEIEAGKHVQPPAPAIPQAWEPVFKRDERVAQRGVFPGTVIATSPTHFIVRYDEERFGTIEYSNAAAFHFGHIPQSGDEKEGT